MRLTVKVMVEPDYEGMTRLEVWQGRGLVFRSFYDLAVAEQRDEMLWTLASY